jgi:hypothetical protein
VLRDKRARHDATRPTANERGYDKQWLELRKRYLNAYPMCSKNGCYKLASDVWEMIVENFPLSYSRFRADLFGS